LAVPFEILRGHLSSRVHRTRQRHRARERAPSRSPLPSAWLCPPRRHCTWCPRPPRRVNQVFLFLPGHRHALHARLARLAGALGALGALGDRLSLRAQSRFAPLPRISRVSHAVPLRPQTRMPYGLNLVRCVYRRPVATSRDPCSFPCTSSRHRMRCGFVQAADELSACSARKAHERTHRCVVEPTTQHALFPTP